MLCDAFGLQIKVEKLAIANPTFVISGVAKFLIHDNSHIFYEGDDLESIWPFILGTAMGVMLQKHGYLVLHGNAIAYDGRCTVFIGPSGAGKSTLAGYFITTGAQILTDDICAIRFGIHPEVIPGYPQIKLWKDSAELLGYDVTKLKPLFKRENKFVIPLGEKFCKNPMPIQKIYVLGQEVKNPFQKLAALIQNTYRLELIESRGERARHLEQCRMLSQCIPIQSLSRLLPLEDGNSLNRWDLKSLF